MFKSTSAERLSNPDNKEESFFDELFDRCKKMMDQHWRENRDLYAIVEKKNESKSTDAHTVAIAVPESLLQNTPVICVFQQPMTHRS